jgi:hypothetical protein
MADWTCDQIAELRMTARETERCDLALASSIDTSLLYFVSVHIIT